MKLLLKALGAGVVIASTNKIKQNIVQENKRNITLFSFNDDITRDIFYVMVKRSGEGIQEITSLHAKNAVVHGTVCLKKGDYDRGFRIDFNDHGKLTGTYWISTDNLDSDIPTIIADRIAKQIIEYPNNFDDTSYNTLKEEIASINQQENTICPYCGKENYNKDAKFCAYCGMRFRV